MPDGLCDVVIPCRNLNLTSNIYVLHLFCCSFRALVQREKKKQGNKNDSRKVKELKGSEAEGIRERERERESN